MRIVWVLGRFAAHDLPKGLHVDVYNVLAEMLATRPSRALATRLMAVKSLIQCDSWDFNEEAFASALPSVVDNLILLMGETDLPDTHLSLNQLFGIVIDRFGQQVGSPVLARCSFGWQLMTTCQLSGISAALVQTLVTFWHRNADAHFRASLLATITKAAEVGVSR